MSGGLALHRLQFPSDAHFASQTQVNQFNTNFGNAYKRGARGDGQRLLCMNFVGLGLAIMIVFIGSKPCWGKGFLRNSQEDQTLAPLMWHHALDHLD
jgi:hypothetical protein